MTEQEPRAGIRDQLLDLQPALLRYARSLTGSATDADDLAQETMARALRFEDRFEQGTDARAWLFTICRRIQQRTWRDQKVRSRVYSLSDLQFGEGAGDEALVSPLSVEPAVMRRLEHDEFLRAFARLSSEHQTVLRMFAVDSRSYEQIARRLGIPIGTVMSRIFRARRTLVKSVLEVK